MSTFGRLCPALLLLVAGCGGAAETVERPRPPRPRAPVVAPAPPEPSMVSWELAKVPEGTFGPYLGERGDRSIVLWAAQGDGRRSWFARALDTRGEPQGEPFRLGDAAAEVGLVAVRPLGLSEGDGFVVVSTSREFSGERVDALALGGTGTLVGGPTPLTQSQPSVVWVDALPTRDGALAFWAVKATGSASLHAVELGRTGQPRTAPKEIAAAARAWQVAKAGEGAAVAMVVADEGQSRGQVVLSFLTPQGNTDSRPLVVSSNKTAESDLDMIALGGRLLLAWSDHSGLDPRVFGAVVGEDGKIVEAPRPLTPARGPQALLRLLPPVAATAPGFIAWENPLERPEVGRAIRVAEITPSGALGSAMATVSHAASDGSVPELDATARGVGVLTLAPACQAAGPCGRDRVVPTFVQLDRGMDVVVSEPVRLAALEGAVAELTWGLSCSHYECLALAALPLVPAPVFSVQLGSVSKGWMPAAERDRPSRTPRVEAIEAIGRSDSISDITAGKLGGKTLVAWITYFDPNTPVTKAEKPAPDGRREPVRAILRVVSVDGSEPKEPSVVSYRARSLGGVSLATDPSAQQALLAWTALEQGEPQVFLTSLRADGSKVNQRMLTRSKGGVSDVEAVSIEDGWLVAWVDMRNGPAEVYVARVDAQLRRVGAEQRLTESAGNVTAVRLVRRAQHVIAAWADARGHEVGVADLFTARLSAKDASPLGPEVRLTRSRDNVHSPALADFGDGAVVAWIEEPPRTTAGQGARLVLQRLDSGAEAAAEAQVIELARKPLGVSLECTMVDCRVVVSTAALDGGALEGFRFVPGRAASVSRFVALETEPEDAAAPVIVGSDVFYGDRTLEGDARLRRVMITWDD